MKNHTKKLNKSVAIVIMILFVGSMFYFHPENTLTDISEEQPITEQKTDSKFIDDSVNEPPTRSVIDYDQWYTDGPSVKTDIEFNKQSFDTTYFHSLYQFDGASAREFYPQYSVFLHDYSYMFTYDASYADFGFSIDSPMTANDWVTVGKLTVKIKADGDGTFYYGLRGKSFDTSANRYPILTTTLRSSVSVTKAELDYEGYYYLQIYLRHEINPTNEELRLYLYKETTSGKTQLGSYVSGTSGITLGVNSLFAEIDEFYFVRDTITNNVRSEYKYNSPTTKTHKVETPSVPHAKEINIYYPESWSYGSINPYASTTDSSYTLTINSPTELDYEVLFVSNCTNYLAIKDVSTDHFTDVGFEGSTDIYVNWASNPFETFETSTEQAFAGSSSLKTVQNSGTYGISYTLLANDYYYVSCWAYIDSIAGGAETVSIAWWNGTVWNYEYFDDTILDRWQKIQFYMQIIDDDNGRNFQFYVSATTATVYFDYESLLFQTSTTIKTLGSSRSQIDFDGIAFDGYKFAQDSFREYQVEIWDKTTQTREYSYTTTTDIFGYGTVTHPYVLEQKEYEIRVFTYDNWFMDYAETVLNDRWDFEEDLDDFVPTSDVRSSLSQTTDEGEGVCFQDVSGSYDWWWMGIQGVDNGGSITIDADIYTTIIFSFKTVTSGDEHEIFVIDDGADGLSNLLSSGVIDASNYRYGNGEYIYLQIHLSLMTWSTGDWSGSQTEGFRLSTEREDETVPGADEDEYYKSIKLVSDGFYSKFYFTPSVPTHTDYAETVQSDSIDWTEGDDEGYYCYTGAIMTDTTEKGYLKLEYSSGTSDRTTFRLLNDKDTSLDYYPDGLIYANGFIHFYTTFAGTFRISRYTGAFVSYMTDISFNSGWKEINMNLNQNWRDYVHEKSFYIQILNTEHNYQAGDTIQIDWINFVHVDSPVLIESDTSFYLSSVDNDYSYEIYSDDSCLGIYADLETILKNNTVGTHNLTYVLFSAGEKKAYLSSTYEYLYTIDSASFSVSVENFYLSDLYVNTYVTSNYDGQYYVYKDNAPDDSGTLSAIGTTISTSRDLTVGVTIAYAIKFVNDTSTIWFNTTYSNPSQDFFITDYRINTTAPNIIITWDTSKNTIDSLTAIEDEITKVTDDPTSTTSWTKSTETGTHYVTLIFSATNFDDIIYSFTYTVAAIEEFQVDVENVFPSDDYLSIYCTSNYNYSYNAYTNGTPSGSGNGLSVGTFIIIPKTKSAGIFNLTVAFAYGTETVLFMTWYSNLIPPPEPNTNLFREQSEGYYNISFITNLDTFWIDIYHDNVLIHDDSTSTAFSIVKDTLIGWHNVSLVLIYNCSTDAEGYPVAEYNVTVNYPLFWYETVLFYDCKIRYTERIYGIAVPEIEVDDVLTYLDGVLIDTLNATSVIQDHSNYSYILNDRIWIHNSARNHQLVVRDLFDNLIYNTTIDIGIIYSMTIELPLEKLYVSNLDDDDRMIKIRPYLSGLDWDADADDLITMILGQYESKSYWVIDWTYESRIYKKVESVSDGVTLWYWVHDPDVEPPPERVPMTIIIPLVTDDDDDSSGDTWWDKVVDFFVQYWFYIALVLLLIVLLISYNVVGNAIVKKLEKTIRANKKASLMAETVLQLLWSSKYDRLVGYKRGKQK